MLKSKRRAFAIQGLVFKENIEEMARVAQWCTESGIDFSINDILPIGRAKENSHLLLSEDQLPEFLALGRAMQLHEANRSISLPEYPVSNPNIYQSIAELVRTTGRPEPGVQNNKREMIFDIISLLFYAYGMRRVLSKCKLLYILRDPGSGGGSKACAKGTTCDGGRKIPYMVHIK